MDFFHFVTEQQSIIKVAYYYFIGSKVVKLSANSEIE